MEIGATMFASCSSRSSMPATMSAHLARTASMGSGHRMQSGAISRPKASTRTAFLASGRRGGSTAPPVHSSRRLPRHPPTNTIRAGISSIRMPSSACRRQRAPRRRSIRAPTTSSSRICTTRSSTARTLATTSTATRSTISTRISTLRWASRRCRIRSGRRRR